MSGALPYSTMSDNRSFISAPTSVHNAAYLYGRAYDDDQKSPAPRAQQHPWSTVPAQGSSRHVPPSLSPVFHDPGRVTDGRPYGSPSEVHTPLSFSQALHRPSPSYRDPYAPMSSPTYYSPHEPAVPYAYPQPSRLPDAASLASQSSPSHSPPAPSDAQLSPVQHDTPAPAYATPRQTPKRREKPRIALAPDQPLTTQGRPRARVYVACIQCRARKIRCDGAKPACHNCTRRTVTGSEPLSPCTYDAAPKRRGPDKNPGSRQRLTTQEISEGGKVRRRRRREPAPTDRPVPTTAAHAPNALVPSSAGHHPHTLMTQMRSPVDLSSAVEALARAPPEEASHPMGKSDFYHGAQQPGGVQAAALSTNVPSLLPADAGMSHPPGPGGLPRMITVNEPPFPQVHTQVTPPQDFAAPLEDIQHYVGFVPIPLAPPHVAGVPGHDYDDEREHEEKPALGAEPSVQLARATWWDTLLALYATHHSPQRRGAPPPGARDALAAQITADLRFLFRASNYWFAFVHVPRFFARLLDPARRGQVQPALVLAALAAANLMRSSEQEDGAAGRAWALRLRDRAQGALDASVSARWVDEGLVQASWLITFFEISPHPLHATPRVRSALAMLDSLVRTLALTALDREDARAARFAAHSVPVVSPTPPAASGGAWDAHAHDAGAGRAGSPGGGGGECGCAAYTLGHTWAHAPEHTPLWLMTPAWAQDAADAETRREEMRRLVWSCVTLIAGYTSFTAASNPLPTMDLFLMDAANYALLLPGASLAPAPAPAPPSASASASVPAPLARTDTVWALYARTMLLWHACVRMRARGAAAGEAEKARFAVQAWLEVDRIEGALNRHTCGVERAFLFQGREYLFNARMCISYEFQRYIPQAAANANLVFHRKKAEEWLNHQASVAKRTMFGLQSITGQPNVGLSRRPFFMFWFMSQVSRALMLWSCDHTLHVALEVARSLLGPIEYMMSMWPCPEQLKRYKDLRDNLAHACYVAGLPDLSPSNFASRLPAV